MTARVKNVTAMSAKDAEKIEIKNPLSPLRSLRAPRLY